MRDDRLLDSGRIVHLETLGAVDHYRPERIYVFASSARGDAKPSSDLDFLVVLPDTPPAKNYSMEPSTRSFGEFLSPWT